MNLFDQHELSSKTDHEINSLILSMADDIAEKLTELECKLNRIECYSVTMEGVTEIRTYTKEAQEIFDVYYYEHVDQLYCLLNEQIKVIQNA